MAQAKSGDKSKPDTVEIHKVNFNLVNYQVGSKVDLEGVSKKDLKVLSVKFGDLTGDGKDEAVVHVSWSFARYGGSGYGYFVDLFTIKDNALTFLIRLDGGGKSSEFQIKLLEIKDNHVVVKRCEINNLDGEQFLATIAYEWNGERLIEIQRQRVKSENCWG